jgi:hypothetical protein
MWDSSHLREKAGAKRLHTGSKQAQNSSRPASFGAKEWPGTHPSGGLTESSRAGHRVGRTLTQYQL